MTLTLGCTMTMVLKQTLWKSPLPNLAPHSSTGCIIPWAVPPPTLDENIISQKALLFLIIYNTVQTILCTIQYSTQYSTVEYLLLCSLEPHLQIPRYQLLAGDTLLYSTLLHCIALWRTKLYCTVLYCTALYNIIVHCTVQHCSIQYFTTLHCKTLHWHTQSKPLYSVAVSSVIYSSYSPCVF